MSGAGGLAGLSVVITGAGAGLGRAYARYLGAAGARIVVNDVDVPAAERVVAEIRQAGGEAVACPGSVADPETAEALVATAAGTFGGLDALVANAGIFLEHRTAVVDAAGDREVIAVNVLGTLLTGAAALRHMAARERGSLVLTTSGSAFGIAGQAAYAASKAAVMGLLYSWACEMDGSGVRVNAVSPFASTGMVSARVDTSAHPPEALAPLVAWLVSDRSAGVHGQVVRQVGRTLSLVGPAKVSVSLELRDTSFAAVDDAFTDALRGRLTGFGFDHSATAPA